MLYVKDNSILPKCDHQSKSKHSRNTKNKKTQKFSETETKFFK